MLTESRTGKRKERTGLNSDWDWKLVLRPRLEKESSILLFHPVSTFVLQEREIASAITCLRAQLYLTS